MINLFEATNFAIAWRKKAEFEVGGGIYKSKPMLHDIDLVVLEKNLPAVEKAVRAKKPSVPVELYVADEQNYPGLLRAIRATTFEAISGRLMSGLKFHKVRIE